MKERGPWRLWILSLLVIGNVFITVVESQSRGDEGSAQELGFDGVLARHDGYVKGETPTIPQTSFSCSAQPYNPGLYADTETQCQVYHVCFEDRQESFLCGPGTNFNQRILACDFWYNFDCQDSPSFYNVNADIGKVPTAVFKPGQSQSGGSQQQPSFPNYPRQPDQPPSVGSVPPRVSIPPPPPRVQPQTPSIQQPPTPPKIDVPRPQVPAFRPQPEPPRGQGQIPRPQPPRGQPNYPQQPQRPSYQPEQPSFRPQPRPDPPISVKPQYPAQGSGHGSGSRSPPPSIQQEEDTGYQFDRYNPSKPAALPPPPPPRPETPRPVFPPVVSPPRVSRPPLTPVVVRQPEPSISRPRVPVSPPRPTNDFHPDAHLKGNGGDYRPPQQPREPQPSRPVGSGYPSYPVAQRPVTPVIPQRPVSRPAYQPPTIQQEHVDTEYVPPPPPRQPSRPAYQPPPPPPPQPKQPPRPAYQPPPPPPPQPKQPIQPARPAYQPPPPPPPQAKQPPRPSYQPPPPPPPQPKQPPRPAYQPPPPPPPQPIQPSRPAYQPPPPPPKQPSRPAYVPPPVQQEQEVVIVEPPQRPSRPYVPPAIPQQTIEPDYGRQPPVAPSVINEQQKPASRPTSRPQVSGGGRQPAKPKPVFPPHSDHPNSNIKGGPGYNQPPPQVPRFEPTRIGRPSNPQGGYVAPKPRPDPSINANKQTGDKRPSASVSSGYKPPQADRIKKPSEPVKEVYQPPIQVVDHPYSEVKGSDYREPVASQQPQRIKTATSSSGVKTPASKVNRQQTQPQRPRAPVVVSRPSPPSLPSSNRGVKQPSPSQPQRTTQPRFPSSDPIDHPNANVKGGYGQQSRPSGPPSSPSTSYEQKTKSTGQRTPSYPSTPVRGDGGYVQQPEYKPERIKTATSSSGVKSPSTSSGVKSPSSNSGVKTASPSTGVKTAAGASQRPHSVAHQSVNPKQPNPNYEAGSSYTRGPEVYPKPEFGQPNSPYQPVSTPSRSSHTTKTGSASQNTISENKPAYQGQPDSSGFGTAVQPSYPNAAIPGHQPPNRPQVFPHRENPDHPNESLKGSSAYRPPPPAGFQAAASEVNLQMAVPEPEPATSLLGDVGAE